MSILSDIIKKARPELTFQPILLDTNEAAKLVCLSKHTLDALRVRGGGPPFLKIGRKVVYKHDDLKLWVESMQTYKNTAEVPVAAI